MPLAFAIRRTEGASVHMEISPWIELAICRQQNLHITFVGDDVFHSGGVVCWTTGQSRKFALPQVENVDWERREVLVVPLKCWVPEVLGRCFQIRSYLKDLSVSSRQIVCSSACLQALLGSGTDEVTNGTQAKLSIEPWSTGNPSRPYASWLIYPEMVEVSLRGAGGVHRSV